MARSSRHPGEEVKIQYILHADFERPGIIEAWAEQNGHTQRICRPFAGEKLPSPSSYDLLILMGGPQDANGPEPYLKAEIELIQKTRTPILGFCLGAQLIGEALGAPVQKSPHKEVGAFPIHLTPDGLSDPLLASLPSSFPAIHWHGDMPGLTPEAKILAYSSGCPRQIVRYAPRIYGFQCHLEPTLSNIEAMIRHCPHDLAPGRYIQTAAQLLAFDYPLMNPLLIQLLNQFTYSNPTYLSEL